jgi:hypothetical protein
MLFKYAGDMSLHWSKVAPGGTVLSRDEAYSAPGEVYGDEWP